MSTPRIAGFSIVRNATSLDFPLEASIGSVLPAVDEFVLAVGRSDDDTLERALTLQRANPKIRILETDWDLSLGSLVLSLQTDIALSACNADWGIYIQADEVLAEDGGQRLRHEIEAANQLHDVEGLILDYLHFYGSFDQIGTSRRWYRREIRAIRLDRGIHSYGDAQGFRVGAENRRVRCGRSDVKVFHYSSARPAWVLQAKRQQDRTIYATEQRKDPDRPLLPWAPGLKRFVGEHPSLVRSWVDARRGSESFVSPRDFKFEYLKEWISSAVEEFTGWRPFEFRNYQ